MHSVIGYEKRGRANIVMIGNHPEYGEIPLLLQDGNLEAYMGAYGLKAGEALTMILVDALVEDINAPLLDSPTLVEDLATLKEAAVGQLDWQIDRNEVLSQITLAEDTAADVVNEWAAYAETVKLPVATYEELRTEEAERRASYVAGNQRREEELLAEEIVSSMDPELLRAPKTEASAPDPDQPVGLSIQFV